MARRAAATSSRKKPAARARGITKIGSVKRTKNTLDVLAERRSTKRTPKKAPADVARRTTSQAIPPPTRHGWTDDRDRSLRTQFSLNPRHAIAAFAKQFGVKRGEVKRRARQLGLLPEPGAFGKTLAPPATCAHGVPQIDGSICHDCAEERDARMRATDAERIAAETPAKREKKTLAVRCPQGDERLNIVRRGKRGFTIVGGAAPERIYGAGANGLPICPTHDVEMIAAEPVEVAEAFRQVQAATALPAQDVLFDTAKEYNADGALVALDALRGQIFAMRDVVAGDKRQTAKHQKDLDTLEASLYAGLEEFMKRRKAKAAKVAEVTDRHELRAHAVCSFERHIGKDCRICHAASRALAIANLDVPIEAYRDVTSEAHRVAAVKANSIDVSRLTNAGPSVVAEALEIAGLYGVSAGDVETWTDDARLDALRWLESDQTAPPPEVLGMPHRAAAPGTASQACLDCGALLVQFPVDDETGERDLAGAFPEGALVGLHCTRDLHAPAPAAETPAAEEATV